MVSQGEGDRARSRPRALVLAAALVLVCVAAVGAVTGAAGAPPPGEIGPALSVTGNGRALHPEGRMTTVGDFPTGGALSPDGRFYWAVDAGHGRDDVQVIDVASGAVVAVLPLPGAYVGVAFAPDGRSAYVSGEPIGDSHPVGPTRGNGGDVIHVFAVDPVSGHAVEQAPIALPATSGGSAQSHAGHVAGFPGPGAGQALDWPEGLAVTPDGRRLVVALNQADRAAIVDLGTRQVQLVGTGTYPYGVAIGHDGHTAYVTNEDDGTLSVIDVDRAVVVATIHGLGGGAGDAHSHPEGIVADPARDRVYVAVANRDLVDFVDTARRAVTDRVSVRPSAGQGAQPVAVALAPDGRTVYSADAGEDAVAAISAAPRSARGPHPVVVVRGVASVRRFLRLSRSASGRRRARLRRRLLRGRTRLACAGPSRLQEAVYVASVLRALRRGGPRVAARLRAARRALPAVGGCDGTIPGLGAGQLIGKLPAAAYPSAVAVTPDGRSLVWLAAKGLGSGPNVDYGQSLANSDAAPYGTYDPDILLGRVGVLARPTDMQVRDEAAAAQAQTVPADAQTAPGGTPLVGPDGGPSRQIKHVFYIVKENRTYDQLFGTEPRGDGDPKLELFDDNGTGTPAAGVTPNAHALVRRFPLLDHFYANSEVSVDGHQITSGGFAIDFVQKALHPNYSNRGRVDEFGAYPVALPPNGYIFDQAARQNVSFLNLGEDSAGVAATADDGRPTYSQVRQNTRTDYPPIFGCFVPVAVCNTDHGAPKGVGTPTTSRFDFFKKLLGQQLASGSVTGFTYLTLPNDHTNGVQAGFPTPRALVADNDLGLGQIVDLISHSPIWRQSAIIVVEDDSQDGADHVDSHRMPAYVISPWARRGAVVHTRYDQESALRTAELILGLRPLDSFDAQATPMYDAFVSGGQAPDYAPYDAITPDASTSETTSPAQARAAGPLTAQLPFGKTDAVPQMLFDQVLWRSVYGVDSTPPPPGPNASPAEAERAAQVLAVFRAGGDVRAWLAAHTQVPPNGEG